MPDYAQQQSPQQSLHAQPRRSVRDVQRSRAIHVGDAQKQTTPAKRVLPAPTPGGEEPVAVQAAAMHGRAGEDRKGHLSADTPSRRDGARRRTAPRETVHEPVTMAWNSADAGHTVRVRPAASAGKRAVETVSHIQERPTVFDALDDGLLVFGRKGQLLHTNVAARKLLGVARGAVADALARVEARLVAYLQGASDGHLLRQVETLLWRALQQELKATQTPADAIRRMLRRSHRVLRISAAPILARKRLAGAILIVRDETEVQRLEHELAERASEIEAIFESAQDGLVFYDTKARITRMSLAAHQLMGGGGWDRPDGGAAAPGFHHAELLDSRGQPLLRAQWPAARILRGETLTSERAVEVCIRRPDGSDVALRMSGAPVRDEQGRVIGAVVSMRDVTEARDLETERAAMMGTVSHELRAPLAVLSMVESLIAKRAALGQPPSRETIGILTEGVASMSRLVTDLIDTARMQIGQLALRRVHHDLRLLCRKVVREHVLGRDRTVTLDLPTQAAKVYGDPARIRQVLGNLVSNALKYSPPERPVTVRLLQEDGMARVEIRDEGPGIAPEAQARLFQRFYRVPGIKNAHGAGGIGLGLYIARTLVELHGGQIGVESQVGRGSTFWFTVPV